jgi:hypothetical protein
MTANRAEELEQSKAPADWLEQLIEDERAAYATSVYDHTISSAAPPREYRNFEPAIFAAVPVTSLRISPEGATGNGANTANTVIIKYKTPAILALKPGDTSAILSVLTAVLILAPITNADPLG